MGRQRASAAGDLNSAAAEAEVASLGIDQHYIAWIGLILQAKTERGHCEAAGRRIAGSISSRARDCCRAHRERLARCHNLVVLVLADDCHARAVVAGCNSEAGRPAGRPNWTR